MVEAFQKTLNIQTRGQGLQEITGEVGEALEAAGIDRGQITIFCCHTSCSLVIMENADPSARRDLEHWLDRLVPEDDPHFTHTQEGADDMPSHIKMALTRTSETIPVRRGRMVLGTWQGLYLWEHRARGHQRRLELSILGS